MFISKKALRPSAKPTPLQLKPLGKSDVARGLKRPKSFAQDLGRESFLGSFDSICNDDQIMGINPSPLAFEPPSGELRALKEASVSGDDGFQFEPSSRGQQIAHGLNPQLLPRSRKASEEFQDTPESSTRILPDSAPYLSAQYNKLLSFFQIGQQFENNSESSLAQSSSVTSQSLESTGVDSRPNYKKVQRSARKTKFIHLKGFWIKDTQRNILIDIDENETIMHLFKKIGERMEETHDDLRGLRHIQAQFIIPLKEVQEPKSALQDVSISSSLTRSDGQRKSGYRPGGPSAQRLAQIEKTKQKYLNNQNMPIHECFDEGDEVVFDIQSLDIWLNVELSLSLFTAQLVHVKGQFKMNRNTPLGKFKKQLQIFGIKLWAHRVVNKQTEDFESNARAKEGARIGSMELTEIKEETYPSKTIYHLDSFSMSTSYPLKAHEGGELSEDLDDCIVGELFDFQNEVIVKLGFAPFMVVPQLSDFYDDQQHVKQGINKEMTFGLDFQKAYKEQANKFIIRRHRSSEQPNVDYLQDEFDHYLFTEAQTYVEQIQAWVLGQCYNETVVLGSNRLDQIQKLAELFLAVALLQKDSLLILSDIIKLRNRGKNDFSKVKVPTWGASTHRDATGQRVGPRNARQSSDIEAMFSLKQEAEVKPALTAKPTVPSRVVPGLSFIDAWRRSLFGSKQSSKEYPSLEFRIKSKNSGSPSSDSPMLSTFEQQQRRKKLARSSESAKMAEPSPQGQKTISNFIETPFSAKQPLITFESDKKLLIPLRDMGLGRPLLNDSLHQIESDEAESIHAQQKVLSSSQRQPRSPEAETQQQMLNFLSLNQAFKKSSMSMRKSRPSPSLESMEEQKQHSDHHAAAGYPSSFARLAVDSHRASMKPSSESQSEKSEKYSSKAATFKPNADEEDQPSYGKGPEEEESPEFRSATEEPVAPVRAFSLPGDEPSEKSEDQTPKFDEQRLTFADIALKKQSSMAAPLKERAQTQFVQLQLPEAQMRKLAKMFSSISIIYPSFFRSEQSPKTANDSPSMDRPIEPTKTPKFRRKNLGERSDDTSSPENKKPRSSHLPWLAPFEKGIDDLINFDPISSFQVTKEEFLRKQQQLQIRNLEIQVRDRLDRDRLLEPLAKYNSHFLYSAVLRDCLMVVTQRGPKQITFEQLEEAGGEPKSNLVSKLRFSNNETFLSDLLKETNFKEEKFQLGQSSRNGIARLWDMSQLDDEALQMIMDPEDRFQAKLKPDDDAKMTKYLLLLLSFLLLMSTLAISVIVSEISNFLKS